MRARIHIPIHTRISIHTARAYAWQHRVGALHPRIAHRVQMRGLLPIPIPVVSLFATSTSPIAMSGQHSLLDFVH